jgi:hypothetical protein
MHDAKVSVASDGPGRGSTFTVLCLLLIRPIGSRRPSQVLMMGVHQRAEHPLTSTEVETLKRLNFNRWRYSRPHDPWKVPRDESSSRHHSGGQRVYKPLQNGNVELEIPSWLVLEALGGSTNVIEKLDLRDDDCVRRVLTGGWEIVNVRMVPGDVTRGEPARVLLELRPEIQVFDDQPRTPGGSSRRR